MPSFLRLITTLTQKINNNDQTGITYVKCNKPTASKDTITTGQLTKATYIEIAGLIQRFMDRNLKAPDYSTKTGLGTYWGYENMIYTYSKILDTNSLPAKISVTPWTHITEYLGTFTIKETKDAATQVKTYIETEKELPEKVTINGKSVEMPAFLQLLTTVIQKINNNDQTPTTLADIYQKPATSQDTIITGQLTKATYIEIAGIIQRYMDRNQQTPNYSTKTGLGTYWGYENIIYTYSKILDQTTLPATLPAKISVTPWNYFTKYLGTFTIQQTKDAAIWVKNYVETNQTLPNTVTINGKGVGMPAFLQLLTTVIQKINNNDQTPTTLADIYQKPATSQDTITTGQITKATYIEIAGIIQRYMDRNQQTPNYSTKTGLGTYWGYENIIYTYSKILDQTTLPATLPAKISVTPWTHITKYLGTFTIQQTKEAATQVKKEIETKKKLPQNVEINGKNVEMPAFLQLLTTVIQKINNNDQTPTPLTNDYKKPTAPQDCQRIGYISLSNYVEIAGQIQRYMDRNLQAPNYSTKTGLGTYWGYENIIYTYSKILDTYNKQGVLPANVEIKLWKAIIDPNGSWNKPVYITTDNIYTESKDWKMMNEIVGYLANWGVNAVAWGRGPNTHCTVINNNSVPENVLVVDIFGGACAATIYEMGLNYYKSWKGKAEIFTIWINPPSWDIRNCPTRDKNGRNFLPIAWDDNFSGNSLPDWGYNTKGELVKGLSNPDKYMENHGYEFMVTEYNTLKMAIAIYEQLIL